MEKRYWQLSYLIVVALFVSIQGCTCILHNSNTQFTQDVAKKLMDREAQRTALRLLGAKYDPGESKLVTAKQIHSWISGNKIDIKKFPNKVQKAINDESVLALLVPKFTPIKTQKTVSRLYQNGGIYLPIFDPEFGIGGFWFTPPEECLQCLQCDGCYGSEGRFCVCYWVCYKPEPGWCRECYPCGSGPTD